MTEHERDAAGSARRDGGADPDESRFQALCEAAYIRLAPSPALRERLAGLAAQHDAATAQRHRSRPFGPPGWRLACSAVAALLCVALLGVLIIRWDHAWQRRLGAGAVNRVVAAPVTPPPPAVPRSGPGHGPSMPHGARSSPRQHRLAPVPQERSAPRSPALVRRYPKLANGAASSHSGSQRPGEAVDDLDYMNRDPEATLRQWAALQPDEWATIEARIRPVVRVRDDFVQIPFPRLVSTSQRQIAEAVAEYKKEAAIVDPRLSREVTLAVKAMAFSDLCDSLRSDTGIEISAGPSVANEKVTIFCDKRPLREVMREINHVFGFTWLRSGNQGQYGYELDQDLRSQLAEEELRNKDLNAALLALDDEMAQYRPYLDLSPEQLKERARRSTGPEQERLWKMAGPEWGGILAYHHLTPAQLTALKSGQELWFRPNSEQPDLRLPEEWQRPLLKASGVRIQDLGDNLSFGALSEMLPSGERKWVAPGTPAADYPGAYPWVRLKVNRSELGQLALEVEIGVAAHRADGSDPGVGSRYPLAVGRSPSLVKPDNAAANRDLRDQPLFQREISLLPQHTCLRLKAGPARPGDHVPLIDFQGLQQTAGEGHVTSADVWEAVHKETGLPIVADSFMHLYPLPSLTVEHTSLYEALCQAADTLGARWRKDGDFLLCRSASYFWDKLKEVPNRLLIRWQRDSREHGGLPLEDVLEMATLSDNQLDSAVIAEAVRQCWGLEEWSLVGGVAHDIAFYQVRPHARFLAGLTAEERRRALQPEGLRLEELTPAQQQELASIAGKRWGLPPQALPGIRLHVDYAPAGWYVWTPQVGLGMREAARKFPVVTDETAEGALTAARRVYPGATPQQTRPQAGLLAVTYTTADGHILDAGKPPTFFLTTPQGPRETPG